MKESVIVHTLRLRESMMASCRLQRACFCQHNLRKGSAIVALVHLVTYIPLFCALSYIRNHLRQAFQVDAESTELPTGITLLTNVAFGDIIVRIGTSFFLLYSVAKSNVVLLGVWLVVHFVLTTMELVVSLGIAAIVRGSTRMMWAIGADVIGVSLFAGLQGYACLVVLGYLLNTRDKRRSEDEESATQQQIHVIKT